MKSGVFKTQTLSEFGSASQNADNSDYRGVLTNSPNLSNDKLSIIADIKSNFGLSLQSKVQQNE